MATKKYPAKIFVVSKNRVERYSDDGWKTTQEDHHNFGFLHPHEPQLKTDANRKETQLGWAYKGTVYRIGDQYWHKGIDRRWENGVTVMEKFDGPIDPQYAPRVWDNVPLTGFRIIDTVSRDRGNKLFKVMDPRGIEFEITALSLFHIITDGEIIKGEIMTPCIWKCNKALCIT